MQYRFWGGPGLLYHPNSIAVVAVLITLRIAPDRQFERWQRYATLAVVTVVLLLVNSRTGLAYLGLAVAVHALLVWRQQRALRRGRPAVDDGLEVYPTPRAAWLGALVPVVMVAVITLGSGGVAFLSANRYDSSSDDVTSGRKDTWVQVFREFRADGVAEKLFGDAKNARATVTRIETGASAADRPKLTTDNSAVGALRRGGILGAAAFLLGLGLLLWHAIRRAPPAWFTLSAVGALASIPFADWLLGGTGGTLWVYLLAGEAALLFTAKDQPAR
jgi:O-antigen ligase